MQIAVFVAMVVAAAATLHSSVGTAGERGNGLGLLLCKELAERNGGEISVRSDLGIGSTFTFTVPVRIESTIDGNTYIKVREESRR